MADTPHETGAIFRSLPQRFRPETVTGYTAVFHWTIAGADEPQWTVRIEGGRCDVLSGLHGQPDCAVEMSDKVFIAIETGQRSPVVAFVKGKIKATNVGALRRYDQAFFKFFDVP